MYALKVLFFFLFLPAFLFPADKKNSIPGLDDSKLGTTLPLEMVFTNENGERVSLKSLIDKPTILMFVYYKCPSLCSPMMTDVAAQIRRVDLNPGKDYQVISISIDHHETPADAIEKKNGILSSGAAGLPPDSWHFLTGDSLSVKKITDLAGISFKRVGDQIAHPGVLVTLTKDGMISRYIIGPKYLPFDIKMSVYEAMDGKTAPTIAKVLQFCFNYDNESGSYVMDFTRIFGILTLLAAAVLMIVLLRKPKKKNLKEGA